MVCRPSQRKRSSVGCDAYHGAVKPRTAIVAGAEPASGNAAMNTVTSAKSSQQNRLEGVALTAMFQGLPMFAGIALCLKLMGEHEIVGKRWGAAIFVAIACFIHALLVPWLAPEIPARDPPRLRAAVLRCEPILRQEDRAMARAAEGFDRTRGEYVDVGAAGGGGGEYSLTRSALILGKEFFGLVARWKTTKLTIVRIMLCRVRRAKNDKFVSFKVEKPIHSTNSFQEFSALVLVN
jgi:hypothetical protein